MFFVLCLRKQQTTHCSQHIFIHISLIFDIAQILIYGLDFQIIFEYVLYEIKVK